MRRSVVALLSLSLLAVLNPRAARGQSDAPRRLDSGRLTFVYYPQDDRLAHSLAAASLASDSFPGLPRPRQRALVAIAPNAKTFRAWVGPEAPEWGAAIALPESRRIVIHGRDAGGRAGDPVSTLRHELAHLALHEALGDLPPRWFDEGYASFAAGEWGRDEALSTSVALVLRPVPGIATLDDYFTGGEQRADEGYALAYRAVAELAAMDQHRGLSLFFQYWKAGGSMDRAVRQAYGLTLADFDQRWRDRTRRRYGGLALTADFAVLGFIGSITLLPLWIARKRRDRRRLEAMRAAEARAERAVREGALAALLAEAGLSPITGDAGETKADPHVPNHDTGRDAGGGEQPPSGGATA
ncbi:MAG: peptidase MA family metallohydrolase [Gemmatimonadaceae bacterium]